MSEVRVRPPPVTVWREAKPSEKAHSWRAPLAAAATTRPALSRSRMAALFYACSEEQKDLSLAEALRRLLSLALAKAREAGIIAEDAVLALIDASRIGSAGRRSGSSPWGRRPFCP